MRVDWTLSRRWRARAAASLGWLLAVGCRAQVRVAVNEPPSSTQHAPASSDLKADPKLDYIDGSVTTAPVYIDGPVPIPGEVVRVPMVVGRKGEPVSVVSVRPSAFVPFKQPDASPPKWAFVRRHRDDANAASAEPVTTIPLKATTSKADGTSTSSVGFDTPRLPAGVYDLWYEGGSPKVSPAGGANLTNPPKPAASQWTTIEIRASLRAASAVVRGKLGTTVDLIVGDAGAKSKFKVTVDGFGKVAELAPGQAATASTGDDGLAHFKVRIIGRGDVYVYARSPGFESVAIRIVGGPLFERPDRRLQPGDVLECQGDAIRSRAIAFGEWYELLTPNPLGRPWYSHVAIYLGNGEVAEMIDKGLVRHSLDEAVVDCTTVDAYRRNGILPKQQAKVVESVRSYGTEANLPYAWEQIDVLKTAGIMGMHGSVTMGPLGWLVCASPLGFVCAGKLIIQAGLKLLLLANISEYRVSDRGRQRMICSELAAWAYRDAAAEFDPSPWWPDIEKTGVLFEPDAQLDFTTPNMVSHSKDMDFVFQVWPPGPPAFIAGDQILLGEQVTFDFASAGIRPDTQELLQHVADLLLRHPEIKHVGVEGHTDDVGSDADNQVLSEKRAGAVRKWFEKHGIAPERLTSSGFGKSRPLVPNNEEHNRRRNRRVEFHIEK